MHLKLSWALAAALVGCAPNGAAPASGPSFELDCEASNTATAAQLNCIRTDTRSGDIVVVDYMRLPVSNGPTATGSAVIGRFTTSCASASTDARSEFYCVRMNTETGELLLVNLQKLGTLPPKP